MAREVMFKGKRYRVPEYKYSPKLPKEWGVSLYVYCKQCDKGFFCDPVAPAELVKELETEHAITHIHEDVKRLEMDLP